MGLDGTLSRHFWLTQGMARSIGLDLNRALRSGELPRDAYSQMIASCCDCDCSGACIAWMAQQGGGATAPPDFCPIAGALKRLLP